MSGMGRVQKKYNICRRMNILNVVRHPEQYNVMWERCWRSECKVDMRGLKIVVVRAKIWGGNVIPKYGMPVVDQE